MFYSALDIDWHDDLFAVYQGVMSSRHPSDGEVKESRKGNRPKRYFSLSPS